MAGYGGYAGIQRDTAGSTAGYSGIQRGTAGYHKNILQSTGYGRSVGVSDALIGFGPSLDFGCAFCSVDLFRLFLALESLETWKGREGDRRPRVIGARGRGPRPGRPSTPSKIQHSIGFLILFLGTCDRGRVAIYLCFCICAACCVRAACCIVSCHFAFWLLCVGCGFAFLLV